MLMCLATEQHQSRRAIANEKPKLACAIRLFLPTKDRWSQNHRGRGNGDAERVVRTSMR